MFHDFNMHGWGMGWGWIIGLIILVVLIWLLVQTFNRAGRPGPAGGKTPMDILKERYAKGEISKKEFEERKKDLA